MSAEELRELNLMVIPCFCGDGGCKGWRMAHKETVAYKEYLDSKEVLKSNNKSRR